VTSEVPDSVALFCELASIPSPSGREAAVVDRVSGYLEGLGLDVAEQPLPQSESRNLLCRLPARTSGHPLLFCAHLDTVPPAGPVEPVLDDGMIRNAGGTILGADDKAAVAVLLAVAHAIVRDDRPHAGVELLFTCQEEVGLQGIKASTARACKPARASCSTTSPRSATSSCRRRSRRTSSSRSGDGPRTPAWRPSRGPRRS
jgi:acetylornithine deacetylase/succinyl-diaminopimelate desuccinylase-like protein